MSEQDQSSMSERLCLSSADSKFLNNLLDGDFARRNAWLKTLRIGRTGNLVAAGLGLLGVVVGLFGGRPAVGLVAICAVVTILMLVQFVWRDLQIKLALTVSRLSQQDSVKHETKL